MKLRQTLSPKRGYLGVTFPYGEIVELPVDFPPDQAQQLLDWGWERVDDPEPVEAASPTLVLDSDPVVDPEPTGDSEIDEEVEVVDAPAIRRKRR
jgi:hypothetical protein